MGGGVTLLQAQHALDKLDLDGDEKTGSNIVRRALEEPVKQIAFNAGLEGGVVVEKTRSLDVGWGLAGSRVTRAKAGLGRTSRTNGRASSAAIASSTPTSRAAPACHPTSPGTRSDDRTVWSAVNDFDGGRSTAAPGTPAGAGLAT